MKARGYRCVPTHNPPSVRRNWGESLPPHGQFIFGVELESDLVAQICDRTGKWVTVREGESHPLPIRQWQHVAFVVNKTTVRLYRNGVEIASSACNGIRPDGNLPVLVIGTRSNDTGDGLPEIPVNWNGRIDELAIFHRALQLKDIRALCLGTTADHETPTNGKP